MVSAKFTKIVLFAALASIGAAQSDTTTDTATTDTATTDTATNTDTTTTADTTTADTTTADTTTADTTTADTTSSDSTTSSGSSSSTTSSDSSSSTTSSGSSSSTTSSDSSSSTTSSTSSDSSSSETSTTTDSSSSTSSSTSSSASATATGGPAKINEVPGGATTDAPAFILAGGAGLARRQAGGFIGGASCTDATVFELNGGVLTSGGSPYGSGDNTNLLFSQSPAAGGETTTWFLNRGTLGWFNTAFYNNQAGFCSSGGSLYITFETPDAADYPANCAAVSLEAIDASRCVNGQIVPDGGNNGNCEYPIGIPRSTDYFITGCPTPTGEVCVPTTVSWIAGSLNFL